MPVYETGSANNANDLLDKFRVFAATQGWEVNRSVANGNGRELCISKGSAYFNFRSLQNDTGMLNGTSSSNRYGLLLNGSDGYSGGAAWDGQPGAPIKKTTTGSPYAQAHVPFLISTGPFVSYHFFAPDDKSLFCELEIIAGTYLRFGVGSLDLFNPSAPGGGRFFYGSTGYWPNVTTPSTRYDVQDPDQSSYSLEHVPFRNADVGMLGISNDSTFGGSWVRAGFESFNNWALSLRSASQATSIGQMACQGGGVHDKGLRDLSPNPLNQRGHMLPNVVSLNINDEYLCPIGTIPGLRYMDMTNYQTGAEITFGTDVWKVFPWYFKGGITGQRAIALRKA